MKDFALVAFIQILVITKDPHGGKGVAGGMWDNFTLCRKRDTIAFV